MATPTWQQAVDNIRAGEIRLKDNKPFTLKYSGYNFKSILRRT